MIFSDYFHILRQFVWLIVIAALLGAGVAFTALYLPGTQYQARFAVTLAPRTQANGVYGNLIDALDRRSVPATFAQVVMSPSVEDTVTSGGAGDHGASMTVKAVLATDSNVIEATITGRGAESTRAYAVALLDASSSSFTRLYPLYAVTALRRPTSATVVPRPLTTGVLAGALGAAVLASLLGLAIDANRHPRRPDRIAAPPPVRAPVAPTPPPPATAPPPAPPPPARAPAPAASTPPGPAHIAPGPGRSRPPWKPRPRRRAQRS